jgi:colanic acid biosynthesis glycosyl transferase WcaI
VEENALRVVIISGHYKPEQTGNAPYVAELAAGLTSRGATVRVLTTQPHYPFSKRYDGHDSWTTFDVEGTRVVKRMKHYVPKSGSHSVRRAISELSFGIRAVFSAWRRPHVIILVTPTLFSIAVALLRRNLFHRQVPVVVWVQDLYTIGLAETGSGGRFARAVIRPIERYVLTKSSSSVVIHDRFKRSLVDNYGIAKSRIEVVRNWSHVSFDLAHASVKDNPFGAPDDHTVVLHAGNIGLKQGLENVVDAARIADREKLPIFYVLLGQGNQRAKLEERASGVERIAFADPLPNGEFEQALLAADVLLLNEAAGTAEMSVPSKLTTYFRSGTPVLAVTNPQGITREEVENAEAALVVDAGQPSQLNRGVLRLREDSVLSASLSANGLDFAQSYLSPETALSHFSCLIEALVRGDRQGQE